MKSVLRAKADFETHHIEGIARMGNVPFNCPLVSHVMGDLWQGGVEHDLNLQDRFEHVISLYPWEQRSEERRVGKECRL